MTPGDTLCTLAHTPGKLMHCTLPDKSKLTIHWQVQPYLPRLDPATCAVQVEVQQQDHQQHPYCSASQQPQTYSNYLHSKKHVKVIHDKNFSFFQRCTTWHLMSIALASTATIHHQPCSSNNQLDLDKHTDNICGAKCVRTDAHAR